MAQRRIVGSSGSNGPNSFSLASISNLVAIVVAALSVLYTVWSSYSSLITRLSMQDSTLIAHTTDIGRINSKVDNLQVIITNIDKQSAVAAENQKNISDHLNTISTKLNTIQLMAPQSSKK